MCPDGGALFGFAMNYMTLAQASFARLLSTAVALQRVGIEVRNDLDGSLFDGPSAKAEGQAARNANLTIPALADASP